MNGQPLEDADIALLVHDVADGWTMPPVRLDAPTWRDRIRSPRARRVDAAKGWLGRLGRAATAAVVLTVAATLIAVVITLPDPGKSPAPSATDPAQASPLPKLVVNGDLPSPSRVVVQTEAGDFSIVDLADGSISRPLTGGRPGSVLQVRLDGRLYCLCLSEGTFVEDRPTMAGVTLEKFEADGTPISSTLIRSFNGAPDPRDEGRFIPDRPPHVLTAMSFSEGGAFGFVGWSVRADSVWQSGLLVLDLLRGEIVSEVALPEATTGEGERRHVLEAPRVVGTANVEGGSGESMVIARSWYEFSPESDDQADTFGVEAYRVAFAGGILGIAGTLPWVVGCGDAIQFGGGLPDGRSWVTCMRDGSTILRRESVDGGQESDIEVSGEDGIDGDTTVLSRDGGTLFAWNPASATLTRVDVATGEMTIGEGLVARADARPLAGLGRWLAPVAAAKTFLRSSVIVSPDGARVYAIGVTDGAESPDVLGSAGVFVFDATTLDVIDIYQPTADFASLAIGADGRFVYAAGLPGVDVLGRSRGGQGPSISVFDTTDGSTRLIAGQLGIGRITFGPEPLR